MRMTTVNLKLNMLTNAKDPKNILALPQEITCHIFSFLSPLDIYLCGQVEELRWVLPMGGGVNAENICNKAAAAGDFKILKWALDQGCKWNYISNPEGRRAQEGFLKLLRDEGCPWDIWMCGGLDWDGELEWWASAKGCPWDWRTCDSEASEFRLEVLEWLVGYATHDVCVYADAGDPWAPFQLDESREAIIGFKLDRRVERMSWDDEGFEFEITKVPVKGEEFTAWEE